MAVVFAPLHPFGWSDFFESAWLPLAGPRLEPARITVEYGVAGYLLITASGEARATLAGRIRRGIERGQATKPVVGDWVVLERASPGGGLVTGVLPRRTHLVRKAAGRQVAEQSVASNVDLVLLAVPLDRPPSPRWIERFLSMALESGARPLVVLTKADVLDPAAAVALLAPSAPGVPILAVSAATGTGLDALEAHVLPGETLVLVGASGAGKSTLLNRWLGEERQTVQAVDGSGKGRHTTTRRELVRLPSGALVIDTPGVRELSLWDAADGIGEAFPDIDALAAQCRFGDCGHQHEPGCAIEEARRTGALDAARLESYRKLRGEQGGPARGGESQIQQARKREANARNRALAAVQKQRGN